MIRQNGTQSIYYGNPGYLTPWYLRHGTEAAMLSFAPKNENHPVDSPQVCVLRPCDHPDVRHLIDSCLAWSMKDTHQRYLELCRMLDAGTRGVLEVVYATDTRGGTVGLLSLRYRDRLRAEIKSVLVRPGTRKAAMAPVLVEYAMEYCRHQGLLKVTLNSHVIKDAVAMKRFEGKGWHGAGTRSTLGTEFYLDLYYREDEPFKLVYGCNDHADSSK